MMLYRIYQEWAVVPPNEDVTFQWMVEVRYLLNESDAHRFIDKVREWMRVDFPNPIFRIDMSEISVEIIGPFKNACEAGEFTDNLMRKLGDN